MRFGCCLNMIVPPGASLADGLRRLQGIGFDYAELPLARLAALDEAGLGEVESALRDLGLRCEACNDFLPPDLALCGPGADVPRIRAYVRHALERAARLQVAVVVFGSAGARMAPPGCPPGAAHAQLAAFLADCAPVADRLGITIAIEPLNRRECNQLTTVAAAAALCRQVAHPRIQLLVDYFHVMRTGDTTADIAAAQQLIRHVHASHPGERRCVTRPDGDFTAFVDLLRAGGYDQRLSLEAYADEINVDGALMLAELHRLCARTPSPAQAIPVPAGARLARSSGPRSEQR